jgi:hypothetical protein
VTFAPAPLRELGAFWTQHHGVNLGVVGDTAHAAKGRSYHLGKSQLSADAYSRQTARDKAGLTEAASAIDLGKLDDSFGRLRAFSRWLVGRCQQNAPGTADIREVIYTADGTEVLRYDRERGITSKPRPGEADGSHLWHTHVSFYRDSEARSKTGLFAPYFALPDTSTEDEVRVVVVTVEPFAPKAFTSKPDKLRRFTATEELDPILGPYSSTVDAKVDIQGNTDAPQGSGFLRLAAGGSAGKYVLASEVTLA